jgi:hypothetical protein
MKKLGILIVACALAVGVAACGKKKDPATPATGGEDMGNTGGTGGDASGGDADGAPAPDGNPCGGEANPCG